MTSCQSNHLHYVGFFSTPQLHSSSGRPRRILVNSAYPFSVHKYSYLAISRTCDVPQCKGLPLHTKRCRSTDCIHRQKRTAMCSLAFLGLPQRCSCSGLRIDGVHRKCRHKKYRAQQVSHLSQHRYTLDMSISIVASAYLLIYLGDVVCLHNAIVKRPGSCTGIDQAKNHN